MHIGIVGPCSSGPLASFLPESGGVDIGCGGYSVVNLVRALLNRGHRVSVITLSPHLTERMILKGSNLMCYVYPMRTKRRMRDLYKVERQGLGEGIILAKADLLHAHWTYEFALASIEAGLPTIVTIRDNAFQVLRHTRDLYRLGRLCLQMRVLRNARFLTAVSPYIANSLRWLARTEIEVIPNLVQVPLGPKDWSCRELGPVRIATVLNGWQRLKNPKAAIRAFSLLRREMLDAQMFMYGDGFQEGGPAAEWTARSGLSHNVYFRGPLPHHEIQRELGRMSILLHPSLEESFGMVIVEAMALGVPVVGGIRSGGVPWVLDEGRAGYLTDVRKPENIAETLLTCIEDVAERGRRQKNAYERVLTCFSPDAVASQYEKLYHRVLKSS